MIPRGELLAELMRLKFGIAVAGSHGKTTTTSMVAAIMTHAGLDPTVVVGGRVGMMGGANARLGKSDYLVVESDESDGSFLKLAPILAVVTNIDREHLDHYADLDEIRAAPSPTFVGKVPFYGAAILCLDDENVQQHTAHAEPPRPSRTEPRRKRICVSHAFRRLGHMAQPVSSRISRSASLGCFRLHVPGAHNVLNAAAAVAVGLELEIPRRDNSRRPGAIHRSRPALPDARRGARDHRDRRLRPSSHRNSRHAGGRAGLPLPRIHVLFQPHRYTRTQALMDDFARSFHQADSVFVLDIYGASENPIEGVSSQALVERIQRFRPSRRALRRSDGCRHRRGDRSRARGRRHPDPGRGQRVAGRRI